MESKRKKDELFCQNAAGLDDGPAENVDFNVVQFLALRLGTTEAGDRLCGVEGSVDGVVTDARAGPAYAFHQLKKGYRVYF